MFLKLFKIGLETIFLHLPPLGCLFDLNNLRRDSVKFHENYIFKSRNYTENNDLTHDFIASFIKKSVFYHVASRPLEAVVENQLFNEPCDKDMR